jgi:hypothetical protein
MKRLLFISLSVLLLQACAIKPWVKPYERDRLADPIMSFDARPTDAGFMNHLYQSREGARGAEGGAGGGCGCS